MVEQEITITNKLGLHARAAVKFVNLANRFLSTVKVEKDGNEVDGKSILGILTLAAIQGSRITMRITGKDEKKASQALMALIKDKFQERE